MVAETYNGWSNYETWNVALWIQNDFSFYSLARDYGSYPDFLFQLSFEPDLGSATPDGVFWDDPRLNVTELNEMISELSE